MNFYRDAFCGGCLNKISTKNCNIRLALKQYWHEDCFRCSICDLTLCDWYFENKEKQIILCRNDYLELYRNHCQQCGEVLSGPFMAADCHKFHPECFACCFCEELIGDEEEYILVERTNIYDRKCFEEKADTSQFNAHTIHFIKVKIQQNNMLPIQLCVEQGHTKTTDKKSLKSNIKISQIDENLNLNQKHIGDKLLEINGIPIKNTSIDSISNMVNGSEKIVQLTLEHQPNKIIEGGQCNIKQIERIFKKKTESKNVISGKNRHKANIKNKERSSSMSTLLGSTSPTNQLFDLSRAKSFRIENKAQKIFRASDLVQGELLGKGFFGQVYKITEKISGEVMVLKELYRVDEEAQKNFLKEVAVLKSLSHPNVLRFIGVLYKNSKLHLITEFVPRTLNEIIHNQNISLPYAQRVSFTKDIATGMNFLHNRNIIHRDLNSFNCLVREDMTVIVADFGLARIISQPPRFKTTSKLLAKTQERKNYRQRKQRYTIVGNPYWMAPEMMKGNKYDEKVDVFSFGIVICELIGRTSADPDYLPRSSDFGLNHEKFIEKFCNDCPESFYLIAFVCCDLNPDKRPPFSTIETWLDMLTNCKAGLSEVQKYVLNNNLDLPTNYSKLKNNSKQNEIDGDNTSEESSLLYVTPKSHLISLDFTESGERLRSSFRTRRHKKSMQCKKPIEDATDDNILLCDTSESEPLSLIEITKEANNSIHNVAHTLGKVSEKLENDKRKSQHGKDAYVIKMAEGVISISGVEKIESFSDIDSSCDTSLNIVESSLNGDNSNLDFLNSENKHEKMFSENNDAKIVIDKLSSNIETTKCKSKLNKMTKETKFQPTCNYMKKKIKDTMNNNPKSPRNLKLYGKHSIPSTDTFSQTVNLNIKSLNKSLDKMSISEKMTESTKAKVRTKVHLNTLKPPIWSATKNTRVNQLNKLKTLTVKNNVSKTNSVS
ncbi:LIM domain kinase 1 isoform X2 [Culicoides brevitarsis]|uniref:LIM domain kinase 1 isoform X2 n=1 Tax=Culicoides brevitarsis TaxID=469753 RepID=UPI00307BF64C